MAISLHAGAANTALQLSLMLPTYCDLSARMHPTARHHRQGYNSEQRSITTVDTSRHECVPLPCADLTAVLELYMRQARADS